MKANGIGVNISYKQNFIWPINELIFVSMPDYKVALLMGELRIDIETSVSIELCNHTQREHNP